MTEKKGKSKLGKLGAVAAIGVLVGAAGAGLYVDHNADATLDKVLAEKEALANAFAKEKADYDALKADKDALGDTLSNVRLALADKEKALKDKADEHAKALAKLDTAADPSELEAAKAELEKLGEEILALNEELGATKEENEVLRDYMDEIYDLELSDIKENAEYADLAKAYFKKNLHRVYEYDGDEYDAEDVSIVKIDDVEVDVIDREDREFNVSFRAKVKYDDGDDASYEWYDVEVEFFEDEDDELDQEMSIDN